MSSLVLRKQLNLLFIKDQDWASVASKLALVEKSIALEAINVMPDEQNEDLHTLNPLHSVPTFADREIILIELLVILEYVDERYPYPPLLPGDPVNRAKLRTYTMSILNDWYPQESKLREGSATGQKAAQTKLLQLIKGSAEMLDKGPYFMGDDFSVLDCLVTPILWTLARMEVTLPDEAIRYLGRVTKRESFAKVLKGTR
jgi:RNA polymerase-associated protein